MLSKAKILQWRMVGCDVVRVSLSALQPRQHGRGYRRQPLLSLIGHVSLSCSTFALLSLRLWRRIGFTRLVIRPRDDGLLINLNFSRWRSVDHPRLMRTSSFSITRTTNYSSTTGILLVSTSWRTSGTASICKFIGTVSISTRSRETTASRSSVGVEIRLRPLSG